MDILAHALWTGVIFSFVNLKKNIKKKLKIWQAVLWGIFPDLFAFTIPFIIIIYSLISSSIKQSNSFSQEFAHGLFSQTSPLFIFTHTLYSLSHSLVIFAVVFFICYFIFKKPVWVMFGWLIHILIDIPSHAGDWATPFLWPISNITFPGVAWWQHWQVSAINYAILLIVYIYLFYRKKKIS